MDFSRQRYVTAKLNQQRRISPVEPIWLEPRNDLLPGLALFGAQVVRRLEPGDRDHAYDRLLLGCGLRHGVASLAAAVRPTKITAKNGAFCVVHVFPVPPRP